MTEPDLAARLHAWALDGAPDEAIDDADRALLRSTGRARPRPQPTPSEPDGAHPRPTGRPEPMYVDGVRGPRPSGRRGHVRVLAAVALVAVVVGGSALVAARRSTGPEPVASAPDTGTLPLRPEGWAPGPCAGPMSRGPHDQQTPEQRAAVEQDGRILQAEMDRTGFGFYSAPTQTGGWMCGWIRVDRTIDVAPSPIANTWGSDTIYDAPNAQAEILGYGYMGLGFFPPEQVAAPDFDPRAMSVERYGCDVFVDQSCQPPATILGNGEEPTYRTE